jgi:hypothetical protein
LGDIEGNQGDEMTEPNDSAHPVIETEHSHDWDGGGESYSNTYSTGGLTKREYFAAMAIQGILPTLKHAVSRVEMENIASDAVDVADYLIEALNKEAK